jgi:hypothetical protein
VQSMRYTSVLYNFTVAPFALALKIGPERVCGKLFKPLLLLAS